MPTKTSPIDLSPLVAEAFRSLQAITTARLAEQGYEDCSATFASVLTYLDAAGARSAVLAQRSGVTRQAMSQLVREMEKRGYVEQVADAGDERAKVVRLTKQGMAVKSACADVRHELTAVAAAAVGKANLLKFQADLAKVVDAMTRLRSSSN